MRDNAREIEFNVDAYTARLIGRENVSKLEGAVLEIVKNAYDADAKTFCLYYSEAANRIYILDNGTGMKEDVIQSHWMTIGNSSKKETYLSSGNRVQTGAKGIGRFALDRISDKCSMLTISEAGGLEWIVDWDEFSGRKKISEVKALLYDTDEGLLEYARVDQWKNTAVAELVKGFDFDGCGTVFCLEGLHDTWDQKTMERLRNHLENLLPPDVVEDFRILFFDDHTEADEAEIVSANIDSYDYKIDFKVEGDDLWVQIIRNEFDFRGEDQEVFKEAGFDEEEQKYLYGMPRELLFSFIKHIGAENYIGSYGGVLYFNKISQTEKDQERFYYKDIKGRANLTKKFGGIKLYRDKFRVRPYGEYGDNDFDWLELSARRNRSPAGLGKSDGQWRVNAEQMLGSVYISRENTNLEDAANRNGIQEGIGFAQLKQVLIFVINEFEKDRQSVGRKLAEYAKAKDKLAAELEKLRQLAEERKKWEEERKKKADKNTTGETGDGSGRSDGSGVSQPDDSQADSEGPNVNPEEVVNIIDALMEQQEQERQDADDERKMLQTLATTGIITNMFMHEIRTLTNNIGLELDAAFEAIEFDNDPESALENIRRAISFKKHFASWFGVTIESIRKDKRKRKKHNINKMLTPFLNTWKDILEKNHIDLLHSCDKDIEFLCFEFDIENIISNLISNSMASFDREGQTVLEKKEIRIDIASQGNGFIIDYRDTGWGLIDKYKSRPELIMEAFESSRNMVGQEEEGTGMGMWIVNRTVKEYNGNIDLSQNLKEDRGFYIKINLGETDV